MKGRSDVGRLAEGWSEAVGAMLLAAPACGGCGAALLLRAAHGRFGVVPLRDLPPAAVRAHSEALDSVVALRRGVVATSSCAALLVAAVATTWYGPPRDEPALRVEHGSTTTCGTVVRITGGTLVL
ncbi:hypothetical protein [Streptomyces sp. NPDC013457]|uniref:hypothetical protein n=1 Tax=Streptomyces sp. NPDC013457 TaxID=3364866 RepID=UPI0036FD82C3